MNRTLEHILPKVQKPARYTGGEYNAVVKNKHTVKTRFALCFPDTYEIGMSNLGCRILYGVMNQYADIWCERCFAPWGDMEEEMRREGLLLYGLESGDPIGDFPTAFIFCDDIRKEKVLLETYLEKSDEIRAYTGTEVRKFLLYRMYVLTIMIAETFRFGGSVYGKLQEVFARKNLKKTLKELEKLEG